MLPRLGCEQAQVLTQHCWSPLSIADVQTPPAAARNTVFLWAGLCLAAMEVGASQVLRNVMRKGKKCLKGVGSICK